MTETRKLKWSDLNKCGEQWLNGIGNAHGYPMTHCARGWFAGSIGGVETGATGRRCAESALVAAGVITQEEADELVWREYRPWAVAGRDFSSDDAGHGLTQEEWGEWADRRTALGISIDPWGWKGDSQ
tara:strand:- start:86 stop:469 length:384 start_codon:yes stop_codon:yes gene_type:complete